MRPTRSQSPLSTRNGDRVHPSGENNIVVGFSYCTNQANLKKTQRNPLRRRLPLCLVNLTRVLLCHVQGEDGQNKS